MEGKVNLAGEGDEAGQEIRRSLISRACAQSVAHTRALIPKSVRGLRNPFPRHVVSHGWAVLDSASYYIMLQEEEEDKTPEDLGAACCVTAEPGILWGHEDLKS